MGLEALDLVFVLLLAAINNLLFGNTSFGFWLIFVIPTLLAIILFFGKRNRPDGHLQHLVKFYLSPGYYSAGEVPKNEDKLKTRILFE